MEKISITVKIPALNGSYEFIVPNKMSVKDVQQLMLNILSSEYGVSKNISDVRLFDTKDGSRLDLKYNFMQLSICDGAKLVLM